MTLSYLIRPHDGPWVPQTDFSGVFNLAQTSLDEDVSAQQNIWQEPYE